MTEAAEGPPRDQELRRRGVRTRRRIAQTAERAAQAAVRQRQVTRANRRAGERAAAARLRGDRVRAQQAQLTAPAGLLSELQRALAGPPAGAAGHGAPGPPVRAGRARQGTEVGGRAYDGPGGGRRLPGVSTLPAPEPHRVARAFVALADTLVSGFDVIDFLQELAERCVNLLEVDAVGILVTDQRGHLRLMAASSEQTRLLELFQLQNEQGPCLEAFHDGAVVHCTDLNHDDAAARWPRFTPRAREAGFAAVSALPMRLRTEVIGAMNLFRARPGALAADQAALGQAMADIATIGLLQERAIRQGEILTQQLQTALNSRVVIEQAKGVLAERHGCSMEQAFTALRDHARSHNHRLTDLAHALITRTLDPTELHRLDQSVTGTGSTG
ncbi:GAF and ANTAR domain-containing protein [Actinomadura sp. 21ATH]|uniref:GAF and ANTAR domain-containing protein n=1 Tax=Actinomadura sp. 21ATH TaxID=1735444 RepID=UPI0035BFA461